MSAVFTYNTIKSLSFSYISAKFEATDYFKNGARALQRQQVDEKWPPLSTDQSLVIVAKNDDRS